MLDLGLSLIAAVERSGDATAIVDGELRFTYREWLDRVLRLVGGLETLGLKRGDHVLSVLQNRWEAATVHWACQLAGLVMTPLNWRAKADEIGYCAADSRARAVFFQDVSAEAVAGCGETSALPRIAVGGTSGGTHDFENLLSTSPAAAVPHASADAWSVMLYTSGTTGRPKGVPRRHRHERAAAVAHVAQNLYAHGERTLGVMPLYHTMGVRSLLAMALVDGCFVCQARFDAAEALDLIEEERITCLYLVPTLYHDLIGHERFAQTDTSSVRKLGFAGAAMPDGLVERVAAAFKPEIFVNHYGSSEIYTFTIEPDAARKPGSAGKAGLNQRIRVVRFDAKSPGDLAAPGEEGEIIADLASDEAFEGYWQRPDADAKAIRNGWYFTGDTGFIDAEGDIFVTGRVDDMIISGGENVSPGEIERVLSLHPDVAEVAVAGLPDDRWGKRITAFLKCARPVEWQELDEWCRRSSLANFKRPRDYIFVREIPKSPVGKVLRRKLVAGEYEVERAPTFASKGTP
ncbi:MAG TPA: AMP-binding protein [Stellaceae bacterium]|nr:AMP-binding protein [Stellaceae bacterium]